MVVFGLVAAAALGGCASTPTGETFSSLAAPKSDSALLYLYRLDEYYGRGLSFKVLVDGSEKANIGNGGYLIIPLEAGKHAIQVNGFGYQDVPLDIEAVNATTSFLRVVTTKGFGGFSATLTLEPAQQAKALQELAGLKREPERFVDQAL